MIEIQGMIAELDRHGIPVSVGCDRHSWRVVVEDENHGEDLRFASSKDVGLFLNGLLHLASRR